MKSLIDLKCLFEVGLIFLFTFVIITLLLQFWIPFKAWDRRKEILPQGVVWHQPLPFTWLSIIIISIVAVSVLWHSLHSEMGCMTFSLQSGWDFVTVSTNRLYYGQKWHHVTFEIRSLKCFCSALLTGILVLKAISCHGSSWPSWSCHVGGSSNQPWRETTWKVPNL